MTLALRTEGATMREIDLIPIRLHKGEPTWEIIDQLIEMLDRGAGLTPEGLQEAIDQNYQNGMSAGYEEGYYDGLTDGRVNAID